MGKAGEEMKLSEMTRILLVLLIVTMVGCESRKNFTNTSYDVFRYTETHDVTCQIVNVPFCDGLGERECFYANGGFICKDEPIICYSNVKCSDGKEFKTK